MSTSHNRYFASVSTLDPIKDSKPNNSEIILHAAAWGWNSNHRSGHLTADQLSEPQQVQRSKLCNYIAASAGKHHSLLVSDRGIVYSFGDGRKGQLGYGNLFTGASRAMENSPSTATSLSNKGCIVQATPAPITPTGSLKFGCDIQCIEVAAGGGFSVAREASSEEGAKRLVGFLSMETALKERLKLYDDSSAVRKAWSVVRQERFLINRISEGLIITWGSGNHGELGLGDDIKESLYPQVS
jgi:alpha-tubulin suppressor-like RCC1 family protein